jgi:maleate cis-trans isomerase
MNDESSNFLTLLRDIKTILSQLYRIESDDYNEFNQFSTGATNIETQRISDRVSVKNPWLKKVTNEELRILYHFFKFMSYQIDRKIRGIPIRYDRKGNMEPPITNLRFLCNYYTMISTAIFIICTYLVVLILIKLIRR